MHTVENFAATYLSRYEEETILIGHGEEHHSSAASLELQLASHGGSSETFTPRPDMVAPEISQRKPYPIAPRVSAVLCSNPGSMTLTGTNTWIIRTARTDGQYVTFVIDPGSFIKEHCEAVADAVNKYPGQVIILVTHEHSDHVEGVLELARRTGAIVNITEKFTPDFFAEHSHPDSPPIQAMCERIISVPESITCGTMKLTAIPTPGHTEDCVSYLYECGQHRVLFCGDTALGTGSTVLLSSQALQKYLASTQRIMDLGEDIILAPGHGNIHRNAAEKAREMRNHRLERIHQMMVFLSMNHLDVNQVSVDKLVPIFYKDLDKSLWPAAMLSMQHQIDYIKSYL